jgi:hypothetical protein
MPAFEGKADLSFHSPDVALWHFSDMQRTTANVRFRQQSGPELSLAYCLLLSRMDSV